MLAHEKKTLDSEYRLIEFEFARNTLNFDIHLYSLCNRHQD